MRLLNQSKALLISNYLQQNVLLNPVTVSQVSVRRISFSMHLH